MPHIYRTLAETYADAGGELNSYIIDQYLPVQAFGIAARCDLVSPETYRPSIRLPPGTRIPPEGLPLPNVTTIGRWLSTTEFCDQFSRMIQPPIAALRKRLQDSSEPWERPTPAEHVKMFFDETHWKPSRLIDKVADKMIEKKLSYQDPVQAAKKQLDVIETEPASPTFLKDYHVVWCEVMTENSSVCKNLQPLDLLWRRPKS